MKFNKTSQVKPIANEMCLGIDVKDNFVLAVLRFEPPLRYYWEVQPFYAKCYQGGLANIKKWAYIEEQQCLQDKTELKKLGELKLIVRQVEDNIYSVEFIGQTTRSHKYIFKDSFHKMLDIFREEGTEGYTAYYKSKEEKTEEIYEIDGMKFKRIMPGDFFIRVE